MSCDTFSSSFCIKSDFVDEIISPSLVNKLNVQWHFQMTLPFVKALVCTHLLQEVLSTFPLRLL